MPYYRMGNVDFKMGLIVLVGSLIGGSLGVEIIKVLRVTGKADFLLKIKYVVMLSLIGTLMLVESVRSLRKKLFASACAPARQKRHRSIFGGRHQFISGGISLFRSCALPTLNTGGIAMP